MKSVDQAWLMVVALKLVVLVIFLLVIKRKVPPMTLILIPLLYIGVMIFAIMHHVTSVAKFAGIILALFVVVWYVPGPLRTLMQKTINARD